MPVVLWIHYWILSMCLVTANPHPYHVSATEMEYDARGKRIEISTKIFTDDFEEVLRNRYKQKVDLANPALREQMTPLIAKYITTHLSIKNNGKALPLQLFGWEIDHEAVFIYTVAGAPGFNPRNILIEKTILYDLFDDQVNIVHFIYNRQRKSNKLVYPKGKLELSF